MGEGLLGGAGVEESDSFFVGTLRAGRPHHTGGRPEGMAAKAREPVGFWRTSPRALPTLYCDDSATSACDVLCDLRDKKFRLDEQLAYLAPGRRPRTFLQLSNAMSLWPSVMASLRALRVKDIAWTSDSRFWHQDVVHEPLAHSHLRWLCDGLRVLCGLCVSTRRALETP